MAKRPPLPFKEIAEQALRSSDSLVSRWLPGGKKKGHEWQATNPNRADNKPGSFTINLNTGAWGDFATDDKGGDLISLYAYLFGLEQYEAAIEVADLVMFKLPESVEKWRSAHGEVERKQPVVDPATVKPKKEDKPTWHPILPVPKHATKPPVAHPYRGIPERSWAYRDAAGNVLSYLYRFKKSGGGKETIPLTWCRLDGTDHEDWDFRSMPVPRPLYGLDRLAAKPDAWVLLVSGEKCADAAVELLPNAAIVTWPGGDNAVDKVDWTPLAGRNIYAWPDCDAQREKLSKQEKADGVDPESKPILPEELQSGMKAMLKVRETLVALDSSTKFKIVDIPAPGEKPSGWDIADAIDEGMQAPALLAFIRRTRNPSQQDEKELQTPNSATADRDWRMLLTYRKHEVSDCRENVFTFLEHHPDLSNLVAYDKFASRIIKLRAAPWDYQFEEDQEWSDNDSLELSLWFARSEDLLIRSLDTINHAVKLMASRNAFDPLIDYLESLEWDGNKRNHMWLTDFAGVKHSEYSELAGQLFLISMVARAYKPGCIMRAMPVFEGRQYRGKSSIARALAGKWFSDSPLDLKGKDGFINIQGTWLHEIAELGSFNNQEAPIIKAYLSSAVDRFRSPFDKYARDYPRRTVFFGTTNEDQYLRDKTGNTRFWPLRTEEVGDIDVEGLAAIRDQLFAEAVAAFKDGARWHPSADEQQRLFLPEQTLREYDDPWEAPISEWLRRETFEYTTVSQVLADCLKIETGKWTQANAINVGKILTRLGWKQSRPDASDEGGKRPRVYRRPEGDQVVPPITGVDDEESIPF